MADVDEHTQVGLLE